MLINNPQQMFNLITSLRSQDPQALVKNMVNEAASQGNPVMQNLSALIQSGETNQIEPIVRNIAKERGIDYDKEFKAFRQMLGFKDR